MCIEKKYPLAPIVILALTLGINLLSAQEKPADPAQPNNPEQAIRASLYYPELPAKELFPMLTEIYHVQFEGIDTVGAPVTLVSKEKVDFQGMLQLLNEVLAKQGRACQFNGKIVQIVPVQDVIDYVIELKIADPQEVVKLLNVKYMSDTAEGTEAAARRPKFIEVHPQGGILVRAPKAIVNDMEKYVKEFLDVPSNKKVANGANTTAPGVLISETSGVLPVAAEPIRQIIPFVNLEEEKMEEILTYLREVYLTDTDANPEERVRKASLITRIPNVKKIIVEAPEPIVKEIEAMVREMDIAPPPPPKPPLFREYLELEFISAEDFARILQSETSLLDKFVSATAPNNILIVSSYDKSIFKKSAN